MKARVPLTLVVLGSLAGCGDSSDGEPRPLRIAVYGEAFIEEGIAAEEFVDGWSVSFSSFLVSVSEIEADGVPLEGGFVFDLAQPSGGAGHPVGELLIDRDEVDALTYRIGPVVSGATGNADPAQTDLMRQSSETIRVSGVAEKEGAQVAFEWAFSTDVRYENCATGQSLGSDGGDSQLTIHSDHLFYDDLDSEDPGVAFDLIASADADSNGQVTQEELTALDITGEARYQVGARDIDNLWDFIAAQTRTVGHIDGEGHCDIAP